MAYSKRGKIVRIIYLIVSLTVWMSTIGGRLFGVRRIVLCYHGIADENGDNFRKQIYSIKDRIIARSDRLDNPPFLSAPFIVLTFDDAYQNLLSNVLPLVEKLKVPVSIYSVTNCLGSSPGWLKGTGHKDEHEFLLSESKIYELSKNHLIEIGAHTHNHKRLDCIPSNEAEFELNESKKILEAITRRKVNSLAFPHGAYNKYVCDLAKNTGYEQVLTLDEKSYPFSDDIFICGRFSMEPTAWPIEFRLTVDGAYSWLYYFRKAQRTIKKGLE